MPHAGSVNPKTGKVYGYVDPRTEEIEARGVEKRLELLKRTQAARSARERLMPYIKFTMPDHEAPNDHTRSRYKNAKHHDAITRVIEEFVHGRLGCQILILCAPPRHGKSEIVSRRLPAWYSGMFPTHNVVVGTYSDEFAMDFGAEVRTIMNSPQHRQAFPEHKLKRGGTAKDRLQTTMGGLVFFVGRGGPLTGRGAHLGIIDDPIKDDKEAQSEAIRNQAWNWFTKVVMTRRMGKKLMLITLTRWNSDDIVGRLTDPENPHYSEKIAKRIKIINLPAIAEEDDPLGRKLGEPLWADGPDKFDLDFLEEQRALDPLGFASLYQQRPTVADGILFRREDIKRYKPSELPEELRFYASSDFAVATGQRNDFTCHLKVAVDKAQNIYVTNCIWRRMPSNISVEMMLGLAGGNQRPLLWWAEKGHISKSIGPFLYKRMQETGIYINIREVTPIGDKMQRGQAIAARAAMGKLYFPEGELWADRAIEQLLAVPNGTHDDFFDALAYIGLGLRSQFGPIVKPRPKTAPVFGTLGWVKLADKWKREQEAEKIGVFS